MHEHEEKLGAHEVAAWLRRHPAFLQQFPDLAVSLLVPKETGPAASLASYQLDVLRDKNRELNQRLHALSRNAEDNERLAVRTHQLALNLMQQTNAAHTVRAMVASLREDFAGDVVRVVLFNGVEGLDPGDWLQVIAEGDRTLDPFRDALKDDEPLCGRLHPDKQTVLYGEDAGDVASSALLAMPGLGLLAVGSRDGNRFFPGMGTLFLRMMGDAFITAMGRFRNA